MTTAPPEDVGRAQERLDAHVREMVAWHFNPETGTPFWLERAGKLGFDPRNEVRGYSDLKKFGLFEDEWLRGGPVRRWVPRGLADKPVYVFETGGTTGIPKSRVVIDDFRIDYEQFSATLPDKFFPRGANWLMLGPSGPRRHSRSRPPPGCRRTSPARSRWRSAAWRSARCRTRSPSASAT